METCPEPGRLQVLPKLQGSSHLEQPPPWCPGDPLEPRPAPALLNPRAGSATRRTAARGAPTAQCAAAP